MVRGAPRANKEVVMDERLDMEADISFDKFMDEILVTENNKKTEEEDVNEHRVKKMLREITNRPSDRTRFVRK